MDKTLDSVGNRYRLCILGDLKGWIGDRTRAGITGAMGCGLLDHYVVLYHVRLVGAWNKRREVVVRVGRVRSEKLREHQDREGYARSLEGKELEWDGDNNVEHVWGQVKRTMVESAREACGSVKVGGKNPKSV